MGMPGGVSAYWAAAFSAQQGDTFGWREYFSSIDGSAETDIVQTETGEVVLDTVSTAWAYQYYVGTTYQKMLVGMIIALNRLTWADPDLATNFAPFHAFGSRVGARGWFGWNKDGKVEMRLLDGTASPLKILWTSTTVFDLDTKYLFLLATDYVVGAAPQNTTLRFVAIDPSDGSIIEDSGDQTDTDEALTTLATNAISFGMPLEFGINTSTGHKWTYGNGGADGAWAAFKDGWPTDVPADTVMFVEGKFPDGQGVDTAWTLGAGGSKPAAVDDNESDGDTDDATTYIRSTAASQVEMYIQPGGYSDEDIWMVGGIYRSYGDGGLKYLALYILLSGNYIDWSTIAFSDGVWAWSVGTPYAAKPGGGVWTPSDVNNTEIGVASFFFSDFGYPAWVTTINMEVVGWRTPAAPPPSAFIPRVMMY